MYRVQSAPQSDLAADQSVGQTVIFLLQAKTGLLEPMVFLLQSTKMKKENDTSEICS